MQQPFTPRLSAADFAWPAIVLAGNVDYQLYDRFRDQLARAPSEGIVVLEMTTLGGDPEVARVIGEDVRFHSDLSSARRFVFLGKAAIYSAGATLMSFFARENRYLTRGTRILIHERQHWGNLSLDGSLTACLSRLRTKINELEASVAIQNEGFENLAWGSSVSVDDLKARASENWYLEANQARELGLVEAVI